MSKLTSKEKFIKALEIEPYKGRVPHFELVFFLTMEVLGKVHPNHRNYHQWFQMSEKEKQLHREDIADIFIQIAEKYKHDAIFLHPNPGSLEETFKLIDIIRDKTGDKYFLMMHGDATFSVPGGDEMQDFSYRLIDEPQKVKEEAENKVNKALERAEKIVNHGELDGFALCADYCFNDGPFLSPKMFSEFVTPYLSKLIKGYRDMGFYTIKHTDGNIMPILDQLVEAKPHALHSLDPQGGVDIAEVKNQVGDKVCLIGNVNCGLMQDGTDEEIKESARYALQSGIPGGGYIFSTSNCVYTGMPLSSYELILDVWEKEGIYN